MLAPCDLGNGCDAPKKHRAGTADYDLCPLCIGEVREPDLAARYQSHHSPVSPCLDPSLPG